jgi:hypothetical protein
VVNGPHLGRRDGLDAQRAAGRHPAAAVRHGVHPAGAAAIRLSASGDPRARPIPLREVYREVEMIDEIDRRDLGEEDPWADTLAKPY